MKITVVGHSLKGLTTASCLAEIGNKVYLCPMDDDEFKADLFQHSSMQDGGLYATFKTQVDEGRLKISDEINVSHYSSDLYFVTSVPDEDVSLAIILDRFSKDTNSNTLSLFLPQQNQLRTR